MTTQTDSFYRDNVLTIPNATPNPNDAAQYMKYKGVTQYKLCGYFAIAYCARDEAGTDNIEDFLRYWEYKEPSWYWRLLFPNNLSNGMGIQVLDKLLSDYGYKYPSPRMNMIPSNPYSYQAYLEEFQLIAYVNIDNTGYLVGKGIPHWVVVERVTPLSKNHAIVDIYNPFTNTMEPYSWREFMTSTGAAKTGVWVGR